MMRLVIIIIFILVNSCAGQTNKEYIAMEKFNIVEFDSLKTDNQYSKTLDDGTIIHQFEYRNGYVEKVMPSTGWFFTYKEFHFNGQLNTKGEVFKKGEFQSGTWYMYDDAGNVIQETDHDQPFSMDLEALLTFINDQDDIPFYIDKPESIITRHIENSQAIWILEWKEIETRRELLYIDDLTGSIIKRDFYQFDAY